MREPPPLSLYVHLPWCVRKCPYCDFNSHTAGLAEHRRAYLDALDSDLAAEGAGLGGRTVETIFLGGGTPSLFSPGEIERILDSVRRCMTVDTDAEVTMEANPGAVERGSLSGYRRAGVNRLSLGAQSFDSRALERLGRIHGPADSVAAFEEARAAGFDNVNLDIMFALPGQDLEAAAKDLQAALALAPEHVSCYQLTLEENTVFHARPPADLPDDDLAARIQEQSLDLLQRAGYERYEVSAFARPGFACRHNLNYWSFGDYAGVGAGAHGKLTDPAGGIWRSEKPAHPRSYIDGIRRGRDAAGWRRPVGNADAAFEFMLNALRLKGGFDAGSFESRTGLPRHYFRDALEASRARGLLEPAGLDAWRPTERGMRFLNDLQSEFLPGVGR